MAVPKISDLKREKKWYKIKSNTPARDWEEYKLYIQNSKFVLGEVIIFNHNTSFGVIAKFAHWSEREDLIIKSKITEEELIKLIDNAWSIAMNKLLKRIFK